MTNLRFFAFVSGLQFALLQFGYLLLFQLNISSTYLSYMLIVLSWMAGTLIGIWWKKLDPYAGLLLGVACYYSVYAAMANYPLSPWIVPATGLGVAATGLWAGRFFVVMQSLFERTDQLFFHENNGFLTGIATLFIGFTLWGRPFILLFPLALTTLLLLSFRRLSQQRHATNQSFQD